MIPSGLRARAQRQNDAKRLDRNVGFQVVASSNLDHRIYRRGYFDPALVRVE